MKEFDNTEDKGQFILDEQLRNTLHDTLDYYYVRVEKMRTFFSKNVKSCQGDELLRIKQLAEHFNFIDIGKKVTW